MAPLQTPPAGLKLVYLWLLGRFVGCFLVLFSIATVLLPLLEATYPIPDASAHNDGFAANFSGPDMLVPTFTLACAMFDFWFSLPLLISQSGIKRALAAPSHNWIQGEKKYGAHHSNPNKHPLEGIVFWGGLDASNPL